MPAAMYPGNRTLVLATRETTITDPGSDDQVKDHLLCGECEQLFNRNGESEVLRWMAPKAKPGNSPLQQKVQGEQPEWRQPCKARQGHEDTHVPDKIVSLFEPTTEVIRKGKASKPTEFGTIVKLQEAEHQIITDYVVYPTRPASDAELLTPALDVHADRLGRMPHLVAADAGFYSARNEAAAHAAGVRWVCVPNRSTKDPARRRLQKTRWFKHGQKWRTGCEGRISVVKRRHGLTRCRYRGDAGMARWVGLGVVADTLVNMGRVRTTRPPA
jgi:IS5 family transposase